MILSIIIPAYNDLGKVMITLNSLHALAAGEHEYIVQDDASPNVDLRNTIPPFVACVDRNAQNLGFAGNCNEGAKRASGHILFFVNHDVFAIPQWSTGWDAALIAAFDDPQVGIVGARLLFPDGSIQSAGGMFDGRATPYHRCIGYSDPTYHEVNTAQAVQWVTGAALAVRRDLFMELGGFDPAYVRGYFEDVELCVKAQLAGFDVWYEPGCTLIHQTGSTGGNPDHFTANALLFKTRWVDSGIVTPDTPAIMVRYW